MSETTEKEAITRFTESIARASSYINDLSDINKHPFSSGIIAQALRDASGSAYQLGHMQRNPDFFRIRDQLELLTKQAALLAYNNHINRNMQTVKGKNPFEYMKEMLIGISEIGKRLATSKAVPEAEIQSSILLRQEHLRKQEKKLKLVQ